jgi:hypothetical protein
MSHIKEMNDWQEFQQQLKKDMDRQVTSNKALLWVGIAINGMFTLIALTIAVVALINALMCGRDNLAVQKELGDCRINHAEVIKIAEKALDRAEQNYHTEAKHASEIRKRINKYHEE